MEEIVNILIVDDVPENLQLLSNILKERNYRVRTLPSGKLVMKSIENNRPDLILLDINMPEMNGYEVCKLVKAKFKDIPIIFISAMNEVFDKVKAFNVGGVDYIAKPFYVDEVYARIKTHIELSRSKHEIQTLLTKTLSGSIKMMTELIASSKPKVFDQASRLKKYALMTAQQLGMANVWKLELAAMFSSTGYVAVSDAIVEKKFSGLELDEEEKKTLDLAFSKSVQLIKNIPRLEDVAEMININGSENKISEEVKLGRDILKVVLDYDNYFLTGDSDEKIIKMMQTMEELYNNWHSACLI